MSRSPLRPATAPHTNKPPGECPYCSSHVITRKGVRKKKLEIVQLWRCGSCKRSFTPGPAALRNKTYPIRMVLCSSLAKKGFELRESLWVEVWAVGRQVDEAAAASIASRTTLRARVARCMPSFEGPRE